MLDSNSLYVVDENGNEKRMTILFTFENGTVFFGTPVCGVRGSPGRQRGSLPHLRLTMRATFCRWRAMKSGQWSRK